MAEEYSIEAHLRANTRNFRRSVRQATEQVEQLQDQARRMSDTALNINSRPFRRSIAQARASLASLPNRIRVRVSVETSNIARRIGQLRSRISALTDGLSGMGTKFFQIFSAAGKGGIMLIAPAAVPVIASAAGAVAGLLSSFTALAGAAGIFGIAAVGNASKLKDSMAELSSINAKVAAERAKSEPSIKRINALLGQRGSILSGMSSEQKAAMKQVKGFQKQWDKFLKATEDPVFDVFASGLRLATSLLKAIQPVVAPAAAAIKGLLDKFNAFAQTSAFKGFIDWLATRGAGAITNWGLIAGNVLKGFMTLMKAFGPLGKSMEGGLLSLSEKFAQWSAKIVESKGFQNFINYVKTNGPQMLKTIANIVKMVVSFGIAIAPLAEKVLKLATSFFAWVTELFKSNPLIAKLITIATMLVGALIAIVPIVVMVINVFRKIWPVIKLVGSILSWLVGGPVRLIITAVVLLAVVIYKNWDKIWAVTKKVFSSIGKFLSKTWDFIKDVFKSAVEIAKNVLSAAWNFIKSVTKAVWDGILAVIKFVWDAIVNSVKSQINFVKSVITGAWDLISSVTSAVWDGITSFITGAWDTIKSTVSSVVGSVKDKITGAWDTVKSKTTSAFNSVKDAIKGGMDKAKSTVSGAMDKIKGFFDIDLTESGKKIIGSAIDGLKSMKKKILNTVDNIAGAVRDFWPFSPAKRGPLSDINKMDFAGPIGDSIKKAKRPLVSDVGKLAGSVRQAFNPSIGMDLKSMKNNVRGLKRNVSLQTSQSLNADVKLNRQPVVVNVYDNKEAVRAYVNDNNAIESQIRRF